MLIFSPLSLWCPQGRNSEASEARELETKWARLMARAHTKAPDPNVLSSAPGDEEDKTYLLFTTGSLTYSPHQIGIKRIMPDQMITSGPAAQTSSLTL